MFLWKPREYVRTWNHPGMMCIIYRTILMYEVKHYQKALTYLFLQFYCYDTLGTMQIVSDTSRFHIPPLTLTVEEC